jgi:ubiquinone/menaquinone biosynthesis C-methylase UbiE
MPDLSERTARKYSGAMAAGYERKRMKQQRWHEENALVAAMLSSQKLNSVLDVPVGTGRFLRLYRKLNLACVGIDSSPAMLALARRKRQPGQLLIGDARQLLLEDKAVDATVCVRFLDLIEEHAMRQVVAELCRVTRTCIILTIRLGGKYVLKVNTATHDAKKFTALLTKCGWRAAEDKMIFKQGWRVLRLERR